MAGVTPVAVAEVLPPVTVYETVPSPLLVKTAVPLGGGFPTAGVGISCAAVMLAWYVSLPQLLPQAKRAAQHNSIMPRRIVCLPMFTSPEQADEVGRVAGLPQ